MVTRVSVHVRVLGSIEVARDGQAIRLAAELFADALGLWRGPAFADAVSPALRSAAGPLAERRVLTVEAKAEADLALGCPEVVVAELSAWLAEMPLRELLRGQLMLALYRLGCRADALNIYRAGHRIMIAEVGLEPGPQLRSLHQRLLADDPRAGGAAAEAGRAGQALAQDRSPRPRLGVHVGGRVRDGQIAAGRDAVHQRGHDRARLILIGDALQDPHQHDRHRPGEVQR